MDKTILLYSITPEELKSLIVSEIKTVLEDLFVTQNTKENYTLDEVSELMKCSKLTIYTYIRKGWLPASKIGRKYIITKANLDKALKEVKSLKYRR